MQNHCAISNKIEALIYSIRSHIIRILHSILQMLIHGPTVIYVINNDNYQTKQQINNANFNKMKESDFR